MANQEPLILSLETSGSACGVCLSSGSRIILHYSINEGNLHDKMLGKLIKHALLDNSFEVENLNAVAVSAGPGSFTGLRIGGSMAKALCFGGRPKLISAPTLEAFANSASGLAKQISADGIIAAVHSHKEQIYIQEFDLYGAKVSEIEALNTAEFGKIDKEGYVLCGNVAGRLPEAVSTEFLSAHSAIHIAGLAYKKFKMNRFTPPENFEPVYVQEFQPKTSRKGLNL